MKGTMRPSWFLTQVVLIGVGQWGEWLAIHPDFLAAQMWSIGAFLLLTPVGATRIVRVWRYREPRLGVDDHRLWCAFSHGGFFDIDT